MLQEVGGSGQNRLLQQEQSLEQVNITRMEICEGLTEMAAKNNKRFKSV